MKVIDKGQIHDGLSNLVITFYKEASIPNVGKSILNEIKHVNGGTSAKKKMSCAASKSKEMPYPSHIQLFLLGQVDMLFFVKQASLKHLRK